MGNGEPLAIVGAMPAPSPSEPTVAPTAPTPASTGTPAAVPGGGGSGAVTEAAAPLDAAGRARYLAQVMDEIEAEVHRRRASGDLPAGLERELDELFLEFSPVGLQARARLRENLSLVDGAAYVDIGVPVASNKRVGVYLKRFIRKSLTWYIGFIVQQVVKFAWATSRMLHLVVDHIEDLESSVASLQVPEVPVDAVPASDPGASWWAGHAVDALAGCRGRVVHAECGTGSLVARLVAEGIDAYGVDPSEVAIEGAVDRGLDVRAESALDHLEVVAEEALDGIVLSGSVQWLHPNDRDRLVRLAASRLAVDGVLVLHSSTPEAWRRATPSVLADLAPGHPLHAETWSHVLTAHGCTQRAVHAGGEDRRLALLDPASPDAATVNAAIAAVNDLLGPAEYLVVATRER